MKKRKRDIFTVIEAVPNWFEAREGSARTSENIEEDTVWVHGREGPTRFVSCEALTEGVDWASYVEGPIRSATGEALTEGGNWASGFDGSLGSVTGNARTEEVTWASNREGPVGHSAGEGALQTAHVARGHGPAQSNDTGANTLSEAQPQSTWTAEVNEWLTATRPPGDRVGTGP